MKVRNRKVRKFPLTWIKPRNSLGDKKEFSEGKEKKKERRKKKKGKEKKKRNEKIDKK